MKNDIYVKTMNAWFALLVQNSSIDYSGVKSRNLFEIILEVTHESINQVKESKINILTNQYDLFKIENVVRPF